MNSEHDNYQSRYPAINPPSRKRPVVSPTPIPEPPRVRSRVRAISVAQAEPAPRPKKGLGGYKDPPVASQFQKGCKPGPGRTKGRKSQDSLWREELEAKKTVRVGGRDKKVSNRALAIKLTINGALDKRDHRHLAMVNAQAARLYPDPIAEAGAHAAHDPAADREVLRQFLQQIAMGEPSADGADPLADMATGSLDLGQGGEHDAWSEGDWDAADGETSDEDR